MKFTTPFSVATTATLALGMVLAACNKSDDATPLVYPTFAEAKDPKVLFTTADGVKVYNGGFGSSMVADPNDPTVFYLMTDRGSNVAGTVANTIIIGKADFTPQIGKFRLVNNQLVLEKTILFTNANGQLINGLPNPVGQGATGETAIDLTGKALGTSADGLDSEGLVLASDGSFWVSDEYGPHIVHFDANGKTIERINPFGTGTGGRTLPKVFAKRRPNRGMEGLTITPDGKTLVGLMQSPMYNPSTAAVAGSVILRILTFDIATGATKQYAYTMDNSTLTGCSEIAAITATTFITLERDGNYGGSTTAPALVKRIYKVDLAGATDISDPANGDNGKLYSGQTVEQLKDNAGLQTAGIVPVTKTLVFDLLAGISPVYPHDKAEGLAIINANLIAVSNDDDFGVVDNGKQGFMAKILPATNAVDVNRVYFVKPLVPLK
jgi:Esterase-like activity of phytase